MSDEMKYCNDCSYQVKIELGPADKCHRCKDMIGNSITCLEARYGECGKEAKYFDKYERSHCQK